MANLKVFQDGKEVKTICYLIKEVKGKKYILLAKHRKQGKWNGSGGAVGDKEEWANETIEEGAKREVMEEIGVEVKSLTERGIVNFLFYEDGIYNKVCAHVFFCNEWKGKPKAIEMETPTWFEFDNLPWDEMWPNDRIWLEALLNDERFLEAEFEFGSDDEQGNKPKVNKFEFRN